MGKEIPQTTDKDAWKVLVKEKQTNPARIYKNGSELPDISSFWAHIFRNIGHIIQISYDFDKNWSLILIIG